MITEAKPCILCCNNFGYKPLEYFDKLSLSYIKLGLICKTCFSKFKFVSDETDFCYHCGRKYGVDICLKCFEFRTGYKVLELVNLK